MANSYTWVSYPSSGASNFESTARAALEANKDNSSSIDEEITAAREGQVSLLLNFTDVRSDLATGLSGKSDLSHVHTPEATEVQVADLEAYVFFMARR